MRADTEQRAGTLRPHVEACKVWPLSVEVPVWHSEASPNEPAEHKRKLGESQGLLAPLKKSAGQRQGVGEGCAMLAECGPHPLSSLSSRSQGGLSCP